MLKPEDMIALNDMVRSRFDFDPQAEISVEMDPNDLTDEKYDALAEIGLTRASIGVQDFDEKVQAAINRIQTFEQTKSVVDAVRARGVQQDLGSLPLGEFVALLRDEIATKGASTVASRFDG